MPHVSPRLLALGTLVFGVVGFSQAARAADIRIDAAEALTGGAAQYGNSIRNARKWATVWAGV